MPQQREGLTHQAGGEDPIEGLLQRLKRHLPLVGAVREVAVRTVKIAERRRLDNQKFQGANPAGGSHRLPVAETAVAEAAATPAGAREVEELSVRFTGRAEATCL